MRKRFNERRFLLFLLIGVAAVVLFSGAVMLLWNNILAGVLKISTITFWQALGILVLSKILFGGFRGGWRGNRHRWGHGMREKWAAMTPEERVKFKEQWQKRCGPWWKEEGVESRESGVGSQETAGF
jgi:Ca2+/H+ antiporter, TMEM165/GDT1 family